MRVLPALEVSYYWVADGSRVLLPLYYLSIWGNICVNLIKRKDWGGLATLFLLPPPTPPESCDGILFMCGQPQSSEHDQNGLLTATKGQMVWTYVWMCKLHSMWEETTTLLLHLKWGYNKPSVCINFQIHSCTQFNYPGWLTKLCHNRSFNMLLWVKGGVR